MHINTRNSLVIVLLLSIETMGFAFIAPVFTPLLLNTPILTSMHGTFGHILVLGLLNAVYPFCMFIATPILGTLSDSWGRKPTFFLSLLGTAIGYLLTGLGILTHQVLLALLGRAIDGLTAGSIPIAQASMADMSTNHLNRIKLMGLTVLGFSGGQTLGPLLGGILSDSQLSVHFTYQLPFYIVTALSLINIFCLWVGFKEPKKTHVASTLSLLSTIKKRYIALITTPGLRLFSFALLMHQLAIALYMQAMVILLDTHYHFSGIMISYYAAFAGVVMAISVSFILPWLAKRIADKKLIILLFSCQSLAIFISGLNHIVAIFWFTLALVIFGTSQSYSLFLSFFSQAKSASLHGWLLGVSAAIVGLGWAISGVLSGILPELGGLITPLWVACGFSVCGVFALIYKFSIKHPAT